jgi:hypothetical protein
MTQNDKNNLKNGLDEIICQLNYSKLMVKEALRLSKPFNMPIDFMSQVYFFTAHYRRTVRDTHWQHPV